jgi:hypothetical protein
MTLTPSVRPLERGAVFDELLVNCRCAGDDASAACIVPGRAADGDQIDTAVGEEAFVLGGEEGMNERGRNLSELHRRGGARAVFV